MNPKTDAPGCLVDRCPVCGGEAERHTCGPFMAGYGHAEWLNVVRCENHCTRGAIKDSWEEAERDWNDRFYSANAESIHPESKP
jgi:hypothetical protein